MTNLPNIRFIKENEMDQLVQLCEAHAIFEKSNFDATGKEKKLIHALFKKEPSLHCLVAEANGELIGYATYMVQFSTWDAAPYLHMDCLFLKSSARSLGIGERLMNRIKEEAKSKDCEIIQWQTPAFNERAMKFYDRIGGVSKDKKRYYLKSQ